MASAVLLIAACSSSGPAPDIAEIEAQISASKAEELELVAATIQERDRANAFIKLLDERERLFERFADDIAMHQKKMAALNADYHAERSEFDAALSSYNRKRTAAQKELIGLIGRMKQATTAEEWKTIAEFQQARLHPRKLAYYGLSGGA